MNRTKPFLFSKASLMQHAILKIPWPTRCCFSQIDVLDQRWPL